MPDASHGHARPRGTARLPGAPARGSASASAAPSPRRRPRGHRPRSRRLGRRGVVGVGGRLSERSSGAGRLARATIQGRGRIGSRAVYDRARLKQKKLFLEPVSHSHGDTVNVILVRAARAGDCGAVYAASDHGLPTLRVCAALAAAGPQRGTRCLTIAKDATPHNLASENRTHERLWGRPRLRAVGRRRAVERRAVLEGWTCHSCAPSRTVSKRPSLAQTRKGGARERHIDPRARSRTLRAEQGRALGPRVGLRAVRWWSREWEWEGALPSSTPARSRARSAGRTSKVEPGCRLDQETRVTSQQRCSE